MFRVGLWAFFASEIFPRVFNFAGVLRKLSSSISEIASSIISSRNTNDGSQKSSSPVPEISATPQNDSGALNQAMTSACIRINSSSDLQRNFKGDPNTSKGTPPSTDRQETLSLGIRNPFSKEINFLHDFYNEGVLLSTSQPTTFFSGILNPTHSNPFSEN